MLRKILSILALISVGASSISLPADAEYVHGYYRKDGTYVRPHYRSNPGSRDIDYTPSGTQLPPTASIQYQIPNYNPVSKVKAQETECGTLTYNEYFSKTKRLIPPQDIYDFSLIMPDNFTLINDKFLRIVTKSNANILTCLSRRGKKLPDYYPGFTIYLTDKNDGNNFEDLYKLSSTNNNVGIIWNTVLFNDISIRFKTKNGSFYEVKENRSEPLLNQEEVKRTLKNMEEITTWVLY